MSARLRQTTSGADSIVNPANRYSVASTSATLVTCPCEADDLGNAASCMVHTASPGKLKLPGLRSQGKALAAHPRDASASPLHAASDAVPSQASADGITTKGSVEADDTASITSSAFERRYRGMSDEEEDQLDRLIRLSTALLSVSKSILGNAKRLAVSESAWSQVRRCRLLIVVLH